LRGPADRSGRAVVAATPLQLASGTMASHHAKPTWPPTFMAGDAHELLGWKRWIIREDSLSRAPSVPSFGAVSQKQLLREHMAVNQLAPDPPYAPASSHLRGRNRHEWARFAGDKGYDPVVGYSTRWAKQRSHRATPFSQLRSASASNLALETALAPLNIRPVERLPPRLHTAPTDPTLHRVRSVWELAPDVEERRAKKQTSVRVDDSSQMAGFLAAHAGRG